MEVLVVDNYDSFTFNLVQVIKNYGANIKTIKAKNIIIDEVKFFDKILFSPGPGLPGDGSIMEEVLKHYESSKSILGVCLGHQAIGKYYGAELIQLKEVCHGRTRKINPTDKKNYLYNNLPVKLYAGLYHSWVISTLNFPDCLKITAMSEEGYIMSVAHNRFDINGIQYHPESIMTKFGQEIIFNWLKN
ncbi:MAG: aminodeoxychorismate/anthranilate synthase component II, partial [Bacteroidales bacterium]|nr:aminodeoxychorismate/anthranilate synthase component II [Bacteroidales bacterium]